MLKSFLKIVKVTKYFDYFCEEICFQDRSKIAKSGHTRANLCHFSWSRLVIVLFFAKLNPILFDFSVWFSETEFDYSFSRTGGNFFSPTFAVIFQFVNKIVFPLIWLKVFWLATKFCGQILEEDFWSGKSIDYGKEEINGSKGNGGPYYKFNA